MATKPWRGWYHCIGNTYGTWLHGDERGFRTRHHREHVEGDYKRPPPLGKYDEIKQRSLQHMKADAVVFAPALRPVVCRVFGESLLFYGTEIGEMSVGAMHVHLLARFVDCKITVPRAGRPRSGERGLSAYDVDPLPRTVMGKAHSYTTHRLKKMGHFSQHHGGLWAKRPQVIPVEDEGHWGFVKDTYIPKHVAEGAALWSVVREREV